MQLILPLQCVEWLFNTPSLHRIHHGHNLRALSKNYGAILSIWDHMFGTFKPKLNEADMHELYYGVVPPLHSWDPLWAILHHW